MTVSNEGESPPLMPRGAARAVALDRDLTHTTLRVLKHLESTLGYRIPVGIAQKHIAQELGVSADDVSRALRQLRMKGIIEQTRDANLKAAFRFNPSYGQHEEPLPTEPETKPKMTPEQEMLATGTPTLFEL
jgi:Crp-like helix-turn-helix domain